MVWGERQKNSTGADASLLRAYALDPPLVEWIKSSQLEILDMDKFLFKRKQNTKSAVQRKTAFAVNRKTHNLAPSDFFILAQIFISKKKKKKKKNGVKTVLTSKVVWRLGIGF